MKPTNTSGATGRLLPVAIRAIRVFARLQRDAICESKHEMVISWQRVATALYAVGLLHGIVIVLGREAGVFNADSRVSASALPCTSPHSPR